MNIRKLEIIPDYKNIKESLSLAKEYGVYFEFNDFFWPSFLDDEEAVNKRIDAYLSMNLSEDFLKNSSLHGVFLDITIFSDDELIRQVSDKRIRQSMEIAKRLKVGAVIFHTNFIANFKTDTYMANWVHRNKDYFTKLCLEYTDINIYMENMFDSEPDLLHKLAKEMKDIPNFGVCLDYAHAHVFGDEKEIGNWVKKLASYTRHLHINDNNFSVDSHDPVGAGSIDWKLFRKYYEDCFSTCSVLLEVSGYERAKQSIDFILNL